MENAGWVVGYDSADQVIKVKLKEPLNMFKIESYYNRDLSNVYAYVEIPDPRVFSKPQRRFYYALLNDIELFWGQPKDYSDDLFHDLFEIIYGKKVSVADDSDSSVEDVTNLINLVVEFVLENDIEIKSAYQYIGTDSGWFYRAIMSGRCALCGVRGERAHVQAVGMGRSRKTIDHTKHQFMSLCHLHHKEQHQIGLTEFLSKYKVIPVWLNREELSQIKLPVLLYEEEDQ